MIFYCSVINCIISCVCLYFCFCLVLYFKKKHKIITHRDDRTLVRYNIALQPEMLNLGTAEANGEKNTLVKLVIGIWHWHIDI